MNNFQRIKQMTVEEMAKELTELMCKDCGYQDNWQECNQVGCWCHKNNGYQAYGEWLLQEVKNENE